MTKETKTKEKVTKKIMVGSMQNYTGVYTGKRWNYEDSRIAYEAFVASLKGLLLTYGKVVIPGLGVFEVRRRKERVYINNLGNGETEYTIPETQRLGFITSDVFKKELDDLEYILIDDNEEYDGGEE